MQLKDRLARALVSLAKDDDDVGTPNHPKLKKLVDAAGVKTADKLFREHCSEEDFSHFHNFLIELDQLLCKYCSDEDETKGNNSESEEEETEASLVLAEAPDANNKRFGKDGIPNDDQKVDHREAPLEELASLKDRLAKSLRG